MLSVDKLKDYGADTQKGLALCMNSEDFYLRMVSMIVEEIAENDLEEGFKAAHALKGVSGNLSLTPLYEKVCEITELLRAKTEMDYSELLQGILDEKKILEDLIND